MIALERRGFLWTLAGCLFGIPIAVKHLPLPVSDGGGQALLVRTWQRPLSRDEMIAEMNAVTLDTITRGRSVSSTDISGRAILEP